LELKRESVTWLEKTESADELIGKARANPKRIRSPKLHIREALCAEGICIEEEGDPFLAKNARVDCRKSRKAVGVMGALILFNLKLKAFNIVITCASLFSKLLNT
jgi:hypothetical protein